MKPCVLVAVFLVICLFSNIEGGVDPIKADLNNDGIIDILDLAEFSAAWLSSFPDPNQFAYIPTGQFQMGNHLDEGIAPNELPVHTVILDSYYISKYEVTNRQYCDFLNAALTQGLIEVINDTVYAVGGTNPYCDTHDASTYSQIDYIDGVFSVRTKNTRHMSNDPMVQVSWYGAIAYCDFYDCRLPTEAEWEYAARGGFNGPYYRFAWGDGISHNQANYYANASDAYYDISPTSGYPADFNDGIQPYTAPVNSFSPHGYGLYNTAGNAWEWCSDWYDANYYSTSPINNPQGPASGPGHVARGGAFYTDPEDCRVSRRGYFTAVTRNAGLGFRVVLDTE